MKSNLKPLGSVVLLKELTMKEKLNSTIPGMIIPDEYLKSDSLRLCEGIVLRTGPEVKRAKQGDKVIFGKNAVSALSERYGDDLIAVWDRDIIFIIEEESEEV